MATCIEPDLLKAYRETHYHVHAQSAFVLRLDEASAALRDLHARHGATCSAFVTAWNPFSRALQAHENAARQQALVAELEQAGRVFVAGEGRHPSGHWPGEDSVLILDMSMDDARVLGVRLEQNAIVWNGPDAVPRLVTLR